MQQIHLLLYDIDGNPIEYYHNSKNVIVTNKTRNERFANDLQIHNPYLFTYTYLGDGEDFSNDTIEFYISKPNSMSVDHRFKLEQIKVKDLPVAKDKFGHDIMINGTPVNYYKFKLANFIVVTDESGNKLKNAEIRKNGVPIGTTDINGTLFSNYDFKDAEILILKTGYNPIVFMASKNQFVAKLQSNPNIKYIKTLIVKQDILVGGIFTGLNGTQNSGIKVFIDDTQINITNSGYILVGIGNEIVRVFYKNVKIFEKQLSNLQNIETLNYSLNMGQSNNNSGGSNVNLVTKDVTITMREKDSNNFVPINQIMTASVTLDNTPVQIDNTGKASITGNADSILKIIYKGKVLFFDKLNNIPNEMPIDLNYQSNSKENNATVAPDINNIHNNVYGNGIQPTQSGFGWKPIAIALIGGAILTKLFSGSENKKGMNAPEDIDYEEIEKPIEAEI